MALEKFIRGKQDNAKHPGRYANLKREQASDYHLKNWHKEDKPIEQQQQVDSMILRNLAS